MTKGFFIGAFWGLLIGGLLLVVAAVVLETREIRPLIPGPDPVGADFTDWPRAATLGEQPGTGDLVAGANMTGPTRSLRPRPDKPIFPVAQTGVLSAKIVDESEMPVLEGVVLDAEFGSGPAPSSSLLMPDPESRGLANIRTSLAALPPVSLPSRKMLIVESDLPPSEPPEMRAARFRLPSQPELPLNLAFQRPSAAPVDRSPGAVPPVAAGLRRAAGIELRDDDILAPPARRVVTTDLARAPTLSGVQIADRSDRKPVPPAVPTFVTDPALPAASPALDGRRPPRPMWPEARIAFVLLAEDAEDLTLRPTWALSVAAPYDLAFDLGSTERLVLMPDDLPPAAFVELGTHLYGADGPAAVVSDVASTRETSGALAALLKGTGTGLVIANRALGGTMAQRREDGIRTTIAYDVLSGTIEPSQLDRLRLRAVRDGEVLVLLEASPDAIDAVDAWMGSPEAEIVEPVRASDLLR